jgi:hypothetical protein
VRTSAHSERRRWIWAALGAIAVVIGFLLLFRAPADPAVDPGSAVLKSRVPVAVVPQVGFRRVAPEEAALVDPTPLFLPTAWNTAQKEVALPKVGGAFADYPARFTYDEMEFRSLAPKKDPAVDFAGALALNAPGAALLGIGRSPVDLPATSRRSAFYEVAPAAGGRVVLAAALAEAKPPGAGTWEPIEFLAVVNAAGLSAPLVPTVRSKLEEVDTYFANYLTQQVRIGAKLAPGVYRIWVGP